MDNLQIKVLLFRKRHPRKMELLVCIQIMITLLLVYIILTKYYLDQGQLQEWTEHCLTAVLKI